MPRHVQGDDAQPSQLGRQARKAVGVVQPTMEGNYRQAVLGPEQMRGQFDVRQAQAYLFDGRTHAQLRSRACQRANRVLIKAAVS